MEFGDAVESAIMKTLHRQLPVPRDIQSLYAVALDAGLSTDEIQAVANEIQNKPEGTMQANEKQVWDKFYGAVNDKYADPNVITDVGPTNGLDEYLPFPKRFDSKKPDDGGYDPYAGGPRPAMPDWNYKDHPAVAGSSLVSHAQDPDYVEQYEDRLVDWITENNTPAAKLSRAANASVNHPQIALTNLMSKFMGNIDPSVGKEATQQDVPLPVRVQETQRDYTQPNYYAGPVDELPDWRKQGYNPNLQKKQKK